MPSNTDINKMTNKDLLELIRDEMDTSIENALVSVQDKIDLETGRTVRKIDKQKDMYDKTFSMLKSKSDLLQTNIDLLTSNLNDFMQKLVKLEFSLPDPEVMSNIISVAKSPLKHVAKSLMRLNP